MTDDPTHDDPRPDDPAHVPHPPHVPPDQPAGGDDLDDTIGALLDDLDEPGDPDEQDDDLDLGDESDAIGDLDADDEPDGPAHRPGDIELDTGHDGGDDDRDADRDGGADDAPPVDADTIALDLDDDATSGYDAQTLDQLAALGGVEADALQAALAELGLDEAPDARSAVVALEHLGVDALVAFGDVDGLVELLDGGTTIQLGDARLVGIDDRTDEAVVETADGRTTRVALDELEQRWAAHGYELVIGGEGAAVLPISLDLRDGGVPG